MKRTAGAMRVTLDTLRVNWTDLPNDGHGGGGFESPTSILYPLSAIHWQSVSTSTATPSPSE